MNAYTDTAFTVRVDLVWLPHATAGPEAGWLLLRRVVTPSRSGDGSAVLADARACTEFWISELIDEEVLADPPPLAPVSSWPALLRGEYVDFVESPVPLYLMRRAELDLASTPRPLLEAGLAVRVTDGQARVVAARVGLVAGDPLTHHVRETFCERLGLARRDTADAPPPLDESRWAADLAGQLRLVGTRGVQIGDHNVQVNRFVADAPNVHLDFTRVLERHDVRDALRQLQAAPGDYTRRRELVRALAGHGWFFRAEPVTLRIGPDGSFLRLLADLLLFDVRGLRVGSHGRQVNRFVSVVTDTPGAAELLRGNDRLARLLTECVCPSPGSHLNVADLSSEALRAFHGLTPEWRDGRTRNLNERPGTTRVFRFVDGLMVGEHNRQEVSHEVRAHALSVFAPRTPPPPAHQKRRTERQVEREPEAQHVVQQERLHY
ncbi:hypothetical protein Val02_31410 [Virgisporangium aliadipatigenens]|uniref:Uncharacterized protein n=1 Tax=Virgisporangium aliadipatigenens TaxID=741659 RepID=A0A8J4DPR9_9ACTN|nr:hypothetical protein [Virgisporangium aliadipatigenens]GIJ46255.1 hypothetical protein Val02_31410 [Virgisporangium aliadipatigenens]